MNTRAGQIKKQVDSKLLPKEKRLKNKLHRFYQLYVRGSMFPTETLRNVYGNRVKSVIRQAVEESYFVGLDMVKQQVVKRASANGAAFVFFISGTDIQNIQDITETMHNQFWTTTSKIHRRENEFVISLATKEMIKKQEFDTEAAYIGIASLMVYTSFNSSVKSKMVQVVK